MRSFLSTLALTLLITGTPALAQTNETHPCYPLEFIISRGTTENSPIGNNFGPNLKAEVESRFIFPSHTVLTLGLIYPATFDLPASPITGTNNLVARIKSRVNQCPHMMFALAGYSQGADVVHQALQQLGPLHHKISSIGVVGDPLTSVGWPPIYQGRVVKMCHPDDRACTGGPAGQQGGIQGHLLYGRTGQHVTIAKHIVHRFTRVARPNPNVPGKKVLDAIPGPGEAGAFLNTSIAWPPAEWATQYLGGWIVQPNYKCWNVTVDSPGRELLSDSFSGELFVFFQWSSIVVFNIKQGSSIPCGAQNQYFTARKL